jgi:hypothetical protein
MKIAISFITYGESTAKYLPYFLSRDAWQCVSTNNVEFKILAIDNTETEDNENARFIKKNYPQIDFIWVGKNLGFAKAYNIMINKARAWGADYFFCINPDTIVEPDAISEMIKILESDENIGAVQPKIRQLRITNYELRIGEEREKEIKNGKTNIIDSLGLVMDDKFRFFDNNQGEKDQLTINNNQLSIKEIFGFTGAATLLRMSALQDVAYNNGYFDELMFMYKEDCDLSMRLRLAGWKIVLAPQAVIYHDRTAAAIGNNFWQVIKNRKNKSANLKRWSFLNQWIVILKYLNLFSWRVKIKTIFYQLQSLIFVLLFEPYLLKELIRLWKIRREIKKRREQLKIKVDFNEIKKIINIKHSAFCVVNYEL